MTQFNVINRIPDGRTFLAETGMTGWSFTPIVEMVSRGLEIVNGTRILLPDYFTTQMSAVPGFPH